MSRSQGRGKRRGARAQAASKPPDRERAHPDVRAVREDRADTRVRSRIEVVLDWANARNLREGPNQAGWKGHLEEMLPRAGKISVQHHAVLPFEDHGFHDGAAASQGDGRPRP